MKIFLFDMDSVLLEPGGYHMALKETVRRLARALGVADSSLSENHIAAFEARGFTSEWDESAVCAALLLQTAWKKEPGLALPDSLTLPIRHAPTPLPAPDFLSLAQALSTSELHPFQPLERAERFCIGVDHHIPAQERILHDLFRGAHSVTGSITHRTFQELVVGSAEFTHTYGLPAVLDTESYLLKYDKSNLSPSEGIRLRDWISAPGHAAAVLTSRPSRSPSGNFCPPEAEMGASLIGLDDIPIAGWGGMHWLGDRSGVDSSVFLKPSPVHALAALCLALGDPQETALSEAAAMVETGQPSPGWERLDGAQVSVFEDTPGGIKSLRVAKDVLEKAGIRIETNYYGVAQKPVKVQALKANEAQVYPTLVKALSLSMD